MATGPKYAVKFRRVREGKTDYKKRLAMLKPKTPRFVVRVSNKNVWCQIIEHAENGDKVLASASSKTIAKMGWDGAGSNAPASYLVGYMCGKKALKAKVKTANFDAGLKTIIKGSNLFAVLKGALDAGLEIPHDESVLPAKERTEGAHIDDKVKTKVAEVKKKIDSHA